MMDTTHETMGSPLDTPSSPGGGSDANLLTPSRKIKALLAQFDDSDSDQSATLIPAAATKPSPRIAELSVSKNRRDESGTNVRSSPRARNPESDGGGPLRGPRGHLAARMQVATATHPSELSEEDEDLGVKAYTRIKRQIVQTSAPEVPSMDGQSNASSEDELQGNFRGRRTAKEQHSSKAVGESTQGTPPPWLPSGEASGKDPLSTGPVQDEGKPGHLPDHPLKTKDSKFLTLVEKHRKARLAREAAEEVKRAERLAQLKKAKSSDSATGIIAALGSTSDESDLSDQNVGKRMTQSARPPRKASKKALEEMSRETQRMSRSMQLTHRAQTKKRITKESLLKRFNFTKPSSTVVKPAEADLVCVATSSAPPSDRDGAEGENTPPTSPLPIDAGPCKTDGEPTDTKSAAILLGEEKKELSAMERMSDLQASALAKGKSKAVAADIEPVSSALVGLRKNPQACPIRVKRPKQDAALVRDLDSESGLEIIKADSKAKKFAAFERLSKNETQERTSHLILRSLAHVQTTKPGSKQSSMTTAEMELRLRKAARLQAHQEREQKVEALRSKGIFIPTDEERLKEQQEVEDLVEQERLKNVQIQRREEDVAKQDGTYIKDQLLEEDSDDVEDEDFQDGREVEAEDHASDSAEDDREDSDTEQDSDVDEQEGSVKDAGSGTEGVHPFDEEADVGQHRDKSVLPQSQERLQEEADDDDDSLSNIEDTSPRPIVRMRRSKVISDDEEEADDKGDQLPSGGSKTPQSVLRSARKVIPGLQMSDDLPIGLTQAFDATMADPETQDEDAVAGERDTLIMTHSLPSLKFNSIPSLQRLDSLDVIKDSQPATQTQPLGIGISSMPIQGILQSPTAISSTQISFMPTQDVGCILSPFKESRFDTPSQAPHSTIDTIILPREELSPVPKRKSRLRRGRNIVHTSDDETLDKHRNATESGPENGAFSVVERAAKKASRQATFDKVRSNAKDVVEEAAEESEDEYAGLGGASEEEDDEEDEADQEMIDRNEKLGQGDQGKLAGFFADKERQKDEAAVAKLYKDITTGGLRRKRGAVDDLDLSDEEDANVRRREAKRREFARMRRELLKDEAVGKIAEDKKKQAFLQSIEDRDDDDDEDANLDIEGDAEGDSQSQSQSQPSRTVSEPDMAASNGRIPLKRPLDPSAADTVNRPAPALRSIAEKPSALRRKPSNLAEVREQISFLIEESESQIAIPDTAASDDDGHEPGTYVDLDRHLQPTIDESEEEPSKGLAEFIVEDPQNNEGRTGFRKPQLPYIRPPALERRTKPNVVDRLSLLRQTSSASSTTSINQKLAFPPSTTVGAKPTTAVSTATTTTTTNFTLPKPLLLRRTTTTSSLNSDSSLASTLLTTSTGGRGAGMSATERGSVEHDKETIRKAQGGKRATVNYYTKGRVEERERARMGAGATAATAAKMGKMGGKRDKENGKGGLGGGRNGAGVGKATRGKGLLGALFRSDTWE